MPDEFRLPCAEKLPSFRDTENVPIFVDGHILPDQFKPLISLSDAGATFRGWPDLVYVMSNESVDGDLVVPRKAISSAIARFST